VSDKLHVVILGGSAEGADLARAELEKAAFAVAARFAADQKDLDRTLHEAPVDLLLADAAALGAGTLPALRLVQANCPQTPIIVLCGDIPVETAAELARAGASDLIARTRLFTLGPAFQRVRQEAAERSRQELLKTSLDPAESRFRAVFEGSSLGIAVEDLAGRILDSNRALQQMLGYNAEELRQIERRDFTHARDHKEETDHFKRLLSGQTGCYQAEKRFVRKDGRIIWGRLTVALARDAAGQPQFPIAMIEDISERQRAEEALQQYAGIVDSSNDAIISQTFDGIVVGWNPGAERLYGFTAREANGRPITIIMPPGRDTDTTILVDRMRRGERVDNFETRRLRKDGTLIDVSITTSPIKDSVGRTIGVSYISRDITQRKKAELRIAALSNLGRRLSSASTAKDSAEIIVEVADELFGWDACSLSLCTPDGRAFNSLLTMDVIDGNRSHVAHVHVNAEPGPLVRRVMEKGAELILRDGPPPPEDAMPFGDVSRPSASLMFVPVRNGPRMIGLLSIQSYTSNAYTRDDLITLQALADHCGGALERIRAEAENRKLAAFPQFNPNPVMELAADGTLNYFNDAAFQMALSLGRDHPSEMLPKETPTMVKACLATGRSHLRHETVIKDRTISWSFFPVHAIGVVHCYAGDITDRQDLETRLRQSQKMESVGQLAGGIAHDFNNILTVIQGHTSLLTLTEGLPKEAVESAQQIGEAAERAANLTRQLLTFSRRQVMQPKPLDLNEVVNNMTKMLRRILGEDITLQVNYASTLPLINADPGMLEQILMNLAVNARDAMPRGGRLFVDTAAAVIDEAYVGQHPEARVGEHVRLTVKDTGVGIAPEHLPRIFEPFFTTKDIGKGTGLGLATVYGIVQQHRGWLTVASKLGVETVFEIFLPAAEAGAALAQAAQAGPEIRGGTETLLLVEDEAPLRSLVKSYLQRYGYTVLDADSGVNALPIWRERKDQIQLLVTDMVMPLGMTGRQLADRLLRDRPGLKVIYSSGYSLAVVGTDMVLREGINFVQKPYNPRKLAQAIRDCLDGAQRN
jgi:two-component system cell cycle sensor histidine kinase/response regulator CckA